jgi:hypothetical protein
MLDAINQREENERFATSKEGDVIMKLTASINYLERETGIATKIEIGKDFLEYLRAADLSKAQEFGELWDGYIKSKL